MDVLVKQVTIDSFKYWIFYKLGQLSTPLLILPDSQMRHIIHQFNEEQEKEEYDGKGNPKINLANT